MHVGVNRHISNLKGSDKWKMVLKVASSLLKPLVLAAVLDEDLLEWGFQTNCEG